MITHKNILQNVCKNVKRKEKLCLGSEGIAQIKLKVFAADYPRIHQNVVVEVIDAIGQNTAHHSDELMNFPPLNNTLHRSGEDREKEEKTFLRGVSAHYLDSLQ